MIYSLKNKKYFLNLKINISIVTIFKFYYQVKNIFKIEYTLKTEINNGYVCIKLKKTKVHIIQVIYISILVFTGVKFKLLKKRL